MSDVDHAQKGLECTHFFSFEFGGSKLVFLNLNSLLGSRNLIFDQFVVVDFDRDESLESIELLVPKSEFILEIDEFLRCFFNSSFDLRARKERESQLCPVQQLEEEYAHVSLEIR